MHSRSPRLANALCVRSSGIAVTDGTPNGPVVKKTVPPSVGTSRKCLEYSNKSNASAQQHGQSIRVSIVPDTNATLRRTTTYTEAMDHPCAHTRALGKCVEKNSFHLPRSTGQPAFDQAALITSTLSTPRESQAFDGKGVPNMAPDVLPVPCGPGTAVGDAVVGAAELVGPGVGVGAFVGTSVGTAEGSAVGAAVGGCGVGTTVGIDVAMVVSEIDATVTAVVAAPTSVSFALMVEDMVLVSVLEIACSNADAEVGCPLEVYGGTVIS